jgi:hypothetical protein
VKLIGLLDLPGTGTGPLRARSPQARLIVGGLLLTAILIVPLSRPWGAGAVMTVAAAGILLAGTPLRLLVRISLVFAVLYVPLLALLLLSRMMTADGVQLSAMGHPGQITGIALRSFAVLMVSSAVVSTLTIADAVRGSLVLPVPRLAVTILFHVLHQASLMLRETVSMSQAVALRGGTRGIRTGLLMARSLPSVWLPRIEGRIERAARAADLRGADRISVSWGPSPWRHGDTVSMALACAAPLLATALRVLH